jgi:hypothetical protein
MALNIVEVYANLIREGKKTIDQVPPKIRPEVEKVLNDENSN